MNWLLLNFIYMFTSFNIALCNRVVFSVETTTEYPVNVTAEQCCEGWLTNGTNPSKCSPTCEPGCMNTDVCKCLSGLIEPSSENNICEPKCIETCVNETCTSTDNCTCYDGYKKVGSSPTKCVAVCDSVNCQNGDCVAPNLCRCHNGYELHATDSFICAKPFNNTQCVFKLTKAIKYDKDKKCFTLNKKAKLNVKTTCPFVSILTRANLLNNTVKIQCLSVRYNGTNEIRCNYFNGIEIHNDVTNTIMTVEGDWSDVMLIVYSYPEVNASSEAINNAKSIEWFTNTHEVVSGCKSRPFTITIGSEASFALDQRADINRTAMWWISGLLITAFVIFVVTGVGVFLWVRHRKLNDPRNYRENMMRGYNNVVYDNSHPRELASDDEEEDSIHNEF